MHKSTVSKIVQRWGLWVRTRPFWLRFPIFLGCFATITSPILLLSQLQLLPRIGSLPVLVCLYLILLLLIGRWCRWVHQQPHPYSRLGLTGTAEFYQELLFGWVIATTGIFLVFNLESLWGWLTWQPVTWPALLGALVNGMLLGVAIALVEELLFRGWLLDELRLDYSRRWALGISSILYAVTHTWGPQLIGLVVVGIVLTEARWLRGDRLSLPIGLHAGWVMGITLVNILNWVHYTEAVPEWVTGIGGNPLAGLLGLVYIVLTGLGLLLGMRVALEP